MRSTATGPARRIYEYATGSHEETMYRNSGRERPGGNSSEAAKNANRRCPMPGGCFDERGRFAPYLVQTSAGIYLRRMLPNLDEQEMFAPYLVQTSGGLGRQEPPSPGRTQGLQ